MHRHESPASATELSFGILPKPRSVPSLNIFTQTDPGPLYGVQLPYTPGQLG